MIMLNLNLLSHFEIAKLIIVFQQVHDTIKSYPLNVA